MLKPGQMTKSVILVFYKYSRELTGKTSSKSDANSYFWIHDVLLLHTGYRERNYSAC